MEKRTFWSYGGYIHIHRNNGKARGGYYFRSYDLNKFIKLVEKEEGEVIGLEFEDNNVNIIIKADDKQII